jgi:hypothetical protein
MRPALPLEGGGGGISVDDVHVYKNEKEERKRGEIKNKEGI